MIRPRNTTRGTIPGYKIIEAYRRAFCYPWWLFGRAFHLADKYYKEADVALILSILSKDRTDLEQYVAEDYDCDDFAFRLMGVFHQNRETAAMPIFITWVLTPQGGHAVLSCYVTGRIRIIEPQTDDIFEVPADWKLILLCG